MAFWLEVIFLNNFRKTPASLPILTRKSYFYTMRQPLSARYFLYPFTADLFDQETYGHIVLISVPCTLSMLVLGGLVYLKRKGI